MPDFNVRSDSVNVEQIMEQIRARISEKRGVDYTEQQIRELASVKLEKFLDPRGVRSNLLDQFKALPPYQPPDLPNYAFEDQTLFESHRAPIRWLRKLLMPLLKLLFNPNPLIQALHIQAQLNAMNLARENQREMSRRAMDQLYYELVHNLVVETTRTGIEVKNLKMRVESISSRLEFNERRARALEGVVVYKETERDDTPAGPPRQAPPPPRQQPPRQQAPSPQPRYTPPAAYNAPVQPSPSAPAPNAAVAASPGAPAVGQGQEQGQEQGQPQGQGQGIPGEGPGQRSRRRRRRRGRRGGGAAAAVMGAPGSPIPAPAGDGSGSAEPVDAGDEMDATDQLEDEGGPEPEETPAAEPRVDPPAVTPPAPVVDPPAAPPAPAIEPPSPPPAPAPAPVEPAAATPPPPSDHADHDPQ